MMKTQITSLLDTFWFKFDLNIPLTPEACFKGFKISKGISSREVQQAVFWLLQHVPMLASPRQLGMHSGVFLHQSGGIDTSTIGDSRRFNYLRKLS